MATREELIAAKEAELAALKAETVENKVLEFPTKAEDVVVDAEYTEVPDAQDETPQAPEEFPVMMVYLGYTNKGNIVFQTEGGGNLLAIEGLLKYAERKMTDIWRQKEFEALKAAEEAAAEAEKPAEE